MKRTESTVIPEDTQLLQGVLLVNYDVQEEIKVDKDGSEYIMYNYGQSRLQEDATQSDIDKCVINGTGYWVKAREKGILDNLVVNTDNVPFDADSVSINYMSAVTSLASFKMLQSLQVEFPEMATYYDVIFKTPVEWKNADNTVSSVKLETIAEALEASMAKIGDIKTKL